MKNIFYESFKSDESYKEPGFYSLSYKGQEDDIMSLYIHVQIVYEHLNRVHYTTLELDITNRSCARFQFHAGYYTGGTNIPKIKPYSHNLSTSQPLNHLPLG